MGAVLRPEARLGMVEDSMVLKVIIVLEMHQILTLAMIGRTEMEQKSPKLTLPPNLDLGTGMTLAAFHSLGTT